MVMAEREEGLKEKHSRGINGFITRRKLAATLFFWDAGRDGKQAGLGKLV